MGQKVKKWTRSEKVKVDEQKLVFSVFHKYFWLFTQSGQEKYTPAFYEKKPEVMSSKQAQYVL